MAGGMAPIARARAVSRSFVLMEVAGVDCVSLEVFEIVVNEADISSMTKA